MFVVEQPGGSAAQVRRPDFWFDFSNDRCQKFLVDQRDVSHSPNFTKSNHNLIPLRLFKRDVNI